MSTYITPHFKWSEALTTDTNLPNIPSDYARANLVQTFRILEDVRVSCNFPIVINSAFRSSEVNKAVGGSKTSYHLDGRAVDIKIKTLTESQINKLKNNLMMRFPVEMYHKKTYIHVAF